MTETFFYTAVLTSTW